jgi:hypothetical protein
VTLAERIVRERPRPVVLIRHRALWRYVKETDVNPAHLAHVDDTKPGILARVSHVVGVRQVLIEGHHRAFKARVLGHDFTAYPLTEEEAEQVLTSRRVPLGRRWR